MISVNLRERIPGKIFDYPALVKALDCYAAPRDKISNLLRKGIIVRAKKGLYLFGSDVGEGRYSPETLANLIYGPSYISLDYGLQYYGLIPERVETLTSVTLGRSKSFVTPVGNFLYRRIRPQAFAAGMDLVTGDGASYLIAVPEKALVDKIQSDRGMAIRSRADMERYLFENLRMEAADLRGMSIPAIEEYARGYGSRKAVILADLIRRMNGGGREG